MSVIDDYFSSLSPSQKEALDHIRQLIKRMYPDVQETIGYGMPVMKLNGKYLLGFSAFKDHLSVFPGSYPVEQLKDQLKEFKTSKGTVQFTLEKPLSDDLLTQIIRLSEEAMHK